MNRPGYRTTEFWVTLSTWLFSSGLTLNFAMTQPCSSPWVDLAVYLGKALIDAGTTIFYIWARTKVKVAEASDPNRPPS